MRSRSYAKTSLSGNSAGVVAALAVAGLLLPLAAAAGTKQKTVKITNQQSSPATININFAANSAINAEDLSFCKSAAKLNCSFTLAGKKSREIPNPQFEYLNMTLAFNQPVTCGSTKAEVSANNPNWFDVEDVSVVDGFNEKIQINVTPTNGKTTVLGPPVGKLGNQAVFGVFPFGCTTCVDVANAPCGDAGKSQCKTGTESNPSVKCQYQMNEDTGTIEVVLLAPVPGEGR